jgi:actin-like ATPase involved in cell morphogenesis
MAEEKVITAGAKLGSKWSSVFCEATGPNPIVRLTCVREFEPKYASAETDFMYAEEAEPFFETIFPLIHGAPRNDEKVPLARSMYLLNKYASWLLDPVPERSGIVYCIPMIRAKEGLKELQQALKAIRVGRDQHEVGTVGTVFLGEAFTAAAGTIAMSEIMRSQTLSINFGSSTVEVVFFSGIESIHQNVFAVGGSDMDVSLINAVEQAMRGFSATENQSRAIKEMYNYEKNEPVHASLTRDGKIAETHIEGNIIREIVDWHMDSVVEKVTYFLRDASRKNKDAVNSLQIDGLGNLVLCGGMVNMPGFAQEFYRRLTTIGGISDKIPLHIPRNGVVAPAIGARYIAEELEKKRVQQDVDTWNEIRRDK